MSPISAQLWPEVSRLMDQALDLPVADRQTWLERLAREQPGLATAVQELLAAHARSETGDFLDRGPQLAVPAGDEDAAADGFELLQDGAAIGPYRLLRPLGSGGMAVVWLAERNDGALTRQVALKLPQRFVWRPGLAERFARERDILARLEHPHIARLYDAGLSSPDGPGAGLPYLVLEYVQGSSLTDYCDTRRLTTPQRLALAMQVLDAVQYAHTQLVIHRDLKPANILVTAAGQVRLLDFGVAKLLAGDGDAPGTQLTQQAGRAFTPDYASPEQVQGQALGTASDVYSLGVVLYELLCGQRPYRLRHGSLAQLEQAIVDVDATPASSHVTDEAAARRGTTARKLQRALRGELDTILLKALQKKPAERYRTAAELAEDLRRHLQGEPVLARPESRLYRLRKFVVRNRLTVGASTAVITALVVASGVSLWQAQIAQRQARRAIAVQDFVTDIFRTNRVDQRDPLKARQTSARDLLDIGARRIDDNLKADPEGRAQVLLLLSQMYFDLGLDTEAAEFQRRRADALRQAFGADDRRVAEALADYAQKIDQQGRDADQLRALSEADAILDRLGDRQSVARAKVLESMAKAQPFAGATTVALAEQAVDIYRRHHPDSDALPGALVRLGIARTQMEDHAGAEAALAESLTLLQRNPEGKTNAIVTGGLMLAGAQAKLHRIDAAERTYRNALALSLDRHGAAHIDTLYIQAWFGWFLHRTSRRAEAWSLLQAAERVIEQGENKPFIVGTVKSHVVYALMTEGRFDQAEPRVDEMVTWFRNVSQGRNWLLPLFLRLQAEQRWGQGRRGLAEQSLAEAWRVYDDLPAAQQRLSINGLALTGARLALARGRADEALQVLSRMPARSAAGGVLLDPDGLAAQALRSRALLLQGRTGEAEATAQAGIDGLAATGLKDRHLAIEADLLLALGRTQHQQGRLDTACAAMQRAVELRLSALGEGSPHVAEAQGAQADCLRAQGRNGDGARLAAGARNHSVRSK